MAQQHHVAIFLRQANDITRSMSRGNSGSLMRGARYSGRAIATDIVG
jgi:hypothetical protein